ncbi:MAG: DUF349 domain-containing protein [Bacteroidales bacterium]|nr:MAG: DUF349 domain-containing protein [Bacteroidales bacterium]
MNSQDLNDPNMDQKFGNAENTTVTSENSAEQEKQPASDENESLETETEVKPVSEPDKQVNPIAQASHDEDEELDANLQPIEIEDEVVSPDDEESDEFTDDDHEGAPIQLGDYTTMSKAELVEALKVLLHEKPIQIIRADVESIKINFYKKHKSEIEKKRKEFVDAGGNIEQFTAPEDQYEPQIKELLKQYRDLRSKYNRDFEGQKVQNLVEKQKIIETIKELVNKPDLVNQSFQEFRELQQRWREIGPVPQANLNDLWETYHHHVQHFYDFVKINNELRDLDLKRNLEEKIVLCEKAEELILEPSVISAFKKLQKYHNQWREVGPVPKEHRTETWERFKEATAKINKKHQEYFEGQRDEQKHNLDAKITLCEKAEELSTVAISSNKDWNKRSKEMIELQKVWKTIGFAPKKDNNKVYERFRSACDAFFNNKRDFYTDAREEQQNNLQLKTELCIQAEALKESNEWKKVTEDLIQLQKRWKEIGSVPRKHSDELWKRFRSACDYFFNQKSQHFAQVDNKYDDNLKAKEQLIEEIESYQIVEKVEDNLNVLKEFQRRWAEIGYVPIQQKESIQKRYRDAINKHFESLKIDESKRNLLKFKSRLDNVHGNPRQENKVRMERDKLFNRLRQIEGDITLWENNIGFFAKSKNAEQMIKDVERNIAKGREEMKMLEEKIRMIDKLDLD